MLRISTIFRRPATRCTAMIDWLMQRWQHHKYDFLDNYPSGSLLAEFFLFVARMIIGDRHRPGSGHLRSIFTMHPTRETTLPYIPSYVLHLRLLGVVHKFGIELQLVHYYSQYCLSCFMNTPPVYMLMKYMKGFLY